MHRIIVSRSHAGKVDVTAKKAFGKKANVVPAGGAGEITLFLFLKRIIMLIRYIIIIMRSFDPY